MLSKAAIVNHFLNEGILKNPENYKDETYLYQGVESTNAVLHGIAAYRQSEVGPHVIEEPEIEAFSDNVLLQKFSELTDWPGSLELSGCSEEEVSYSTLRCQRPDSSVFYFKPFELNGDTRKDLATAAINERMGLESVPKMFVARVNDKLGVYIENVGAPFRLMDNSRFLEDDRFAPSLSDARGLDYLMCGTDRHDLNVLIADPEDLGGLGKVKILDFAENHNDLLPWKRDESVYPTQGRLPGRFSKQFIRGFRGLTPEIIRQDLLPYLGRLEIEGTVLRWYVLRYQIVTSHGLSALDPLTFLPPNAL